MNVLLGDDRWGGVLVADPGGPAIGVLPDGGNVLW
jgi:hypothetical protein